MPRLSKHRATQSRPERRASAPRPFRRSRRAERSRPGSQERRHVERQVDDAVRFLVFTKIKFSSLLNFHENQVFATDKSSRKSSFDTPCADFRAMVGTCEHLRFVNNHEHPATPCKAARRAACEDWWLQNKSQVEFSFCSIPPPTKISVISRTRTPSSPFPPPIPHDPPF